MSYRDFRVADIRDRLRLVMDMSKSLFPEVKPFEARPLIHESLASYGPLALAVNSEKARSEWLIAPILAELWNSLDHQVGVYSGIEFNVDAEDELTGICDFILTGSPQQPLITAPVMTIVEAKKENIYDGLGQCAAAMVAARRFNMKSRQEREVMYGCVTSGNLWRFLSLRHNTLHVDLDEYTLTQVNKILGILRFCCGVTAAK